MNWTEAQLNEYLEKGGRVKANVDNRVAVPVADMEPAICDAPVAEEKSPGLDTPCSILVHSVRARLADSDGISGKATLDGIVHAGLLPDDSPEYVEEVRYRQTKGKEEVTYIHIYKESGEG